MTTMNPYTFRGWHLPSYADGAANYERNYHMYGSLPSGYFSPATSVYPFNTDSQKQHNVDWKIQSSSVCSASSDGSPNNLRDAGIGKPVYDGLYKSNACRNTDSNEEHQRSCCALSCTCSNLQQRLPMLNNSWTGSDLSALDFNKTTMAMSTMSPYQSLCNRGLPLPHSSYPEKSNEYEFKCNGEESKIRYCDESIQFADNDKCFTKVII